MGATKHYMVHNVYRYEKSFKDPDAALEIFADIPFLNGGLFECLDKRTGTADKPVDIRIDSFSDRDDNPLSVPNFLFFGDEREVDLNDIYGTKSKRYKAQGIVNILSRAENRAARSRGRESRAHVRAACFRVRSRDHDPHRRVGGRSGVWRRECAALRRRQR